MKKETPGKVIITPRPPVGSGSESPEADIILKCELPDMSELKPISRKDAEDQVIDPRKVEAPDLKKVAKDLKDKAKVEGPKLVNKRCK